MSPTSPLSAEVLEQLRGITSPTVCNSIETFQVRDNASGFMGPEIKCVLPRLGVMVGYACTAVIGARVAGGSKGRVPFTELFEHIASVPEPRVMVVHDVDSPRPIGSFWGEVNGNIHKAQGVVGAVTDGGVRDLPEVEALRFHYFASEVLVSHGNLYIVDVGVPVEVGGLRVEPGDLLHGDEHGVTSIPLELAKQIPDAARKVEAQERGIIELCQSPDFSKEKLLKLFAGGEG